MFDNVLRELTERFSLGDKAQPLLGSLLAQIFDTEHGGFAGFRERFVAAGFGERFDSWLGEGNDAKPLEAGDVTQALGENTIAVMASKLGLSSAAVSGTLAGLLPKVVSELTPGGLLPKSLPAGFGSWATHEASAHSRTIGAAAAVVPQPPLDDSSLQMAKWLIPLVLATALGYCAMVHDKPPAPPTEGDVVEVSEVAPIMAPSRLSLTIKGGQLRYAGQMAGAADKERVDKALTETFGANAGSGSIAVTPDTKTAPWLAALIGLVPQLKDRDVQLDFEGDKLVVTGGDSASNQALLAELNSRFDKLRIETDLTPVMSAAETTPAASEATTEAVPAVTEPAAAPDAKAALDALQAGNFSADDLVKALNMMGVQFDTGSATISAASKDILAQAAEVLKKAPAGIRVEIGGHTDNTGKADANLKLSEARAKAVHDRLIELGVATDRLDAKGYGDTKPIADNGTDAGRTQNRRMEFALVK